MSKYNIHAGHCPDGKGASGAVGLIKESMEDRIIKNKVISYLKAQGHTVYDCTCDENTTQNGCLKNIVSKCNAHSVDLDVSIHFNSGASDTAGNGKSTGTEAWIYPNSSAKSKAQAIVDGIAKLGFKNRGVKTSSSLYVLRKTKSPAVLVEVCFVDDKDDVDLYKANVDNVAKAIVNGITGSEVATITTTTATTTAKSSNYDEWVARLQKAIGASVDGIWGNETLSKCPTLKKGSKGAVVKLLQERLNSVGFNLTVDGDFGTNTYKAVKTFQKNRSLTQDGIVGKNTWKWLLKGTKM